MSKTSNYIDSSIDYRSILQSLCDDGTIQPTAVEKKISDMTRKEIKNKVIDKLGYEPKIYLKKDGRKFAKIKLNNEWTQFLGQNEEGVYKKLYDFYYGDRSITLAGLFPRFMLYRRDMGKVTNKTLVENTNDWNRFLKDSAISNVPIRELTPRDYIKFFENLTKDRHFTHKRISNLKSLLNKMYSYAIREDLVDYNPIKSVDFSEFNYFVPDNSEQVYTLENRDKLLEYLYNIKEPYALAIQLDFQLTCRIGELKGLRWANIDFQRRTITINTQALKQRHLNDDLSFSQSSVEVVSRIKGNTESGKRVLKITQEAERILRIAKEINPNGEFVFMPYGKVMLTDTFNEYLKKYCACAHVPYFSSHKIRFTTCSMLYQTSDDIVEVSRAMGHSQTATTVHYLRNVNDDSSLQKHMEDAFAPNRTKN